MRIFAPAGAAAPPDAAALPVAPPGAALPGDEFGDPRLQQEAMLRALVHRAYVVDSSAAVAALELNRAGETELSIGILLSIIESAPPAPAQRQRQQPAAGGGSGEGGGGV